MSKRRWLGYGEGGLGFSALAAAPLTLSRISKRKWMMDGYKAGPDDVKMTEEV